MISNCRFGYYDYDVEMHVIYSELNVVKWFT